MILLQDYFEGRLGDLVLVAPGSELAGSLPEQYMKFSDHFIEDTSLKDGRYWDRLLRHLYIYQINRDLIDDGVWATREVPPITDEEKETIERSVAFSKYQEMVELSQRWLPS